jgi:hypothetical protein
MLKVIIWALLGAGLLNGLARIPHHAPGLLLLMEWAAPGAYTIIASSIAAAAHDRKDLIVLILLLTMLAAYPFDAQDVARLLIPLGSGILLGSILRTTLQQEQPQEARHERAPR